MEQKTMKAGAARVDITPPLGTRINGDFVAHYATEVHDPLYAKALVLEYGSEIIALVVVDICTMPKQFVDEVKETIWKEIALPPTHVLMASTHTHAAGAIGDTYLAAEDRVYRERLGPLIASAVVQAMANRRAAKLAFGKVLAPEHVTCRRYFMKAGCSPRNPVTDAIEPVKTNPFGLESFIDRRVAPEDPELSFLAVKGLDDCWIALLGNYSLHYVGDWPNGVISADYFGAFARHVQSALHAGDDFIGIMSNGTSGDVNIWDFMAPDRYPTACFEKSGQIAEDLAQKVATEVAHLQWDETPELRVAFEEILLKLEKPSMASLQRAAAVIRKSNLEGFALDDESLKAVYAREQLLLHEMSDEVRLPLQAIRIGNGMIGGLCGEFFSETGLWLKAHSRAAHYFSIGLANGNFGYVPPEREFELGGYETWRSRYSCLAPGAEDLIKQALHRLTLAL